MIWIIAFGVILLIALVLLTMKASTPVNEVAVFWRMFAGAWLFLVAMGGLAVVGVTAIVMNMLGVPIG